MASIRTIQRSINQILSSLQGVKELKVDGKLGSRPENSKTVTAIKAFQKNLVGMARPDGRIDVNGRSHRKLSESISLAATKRVTKIPSSFTLKLKIKIEQYEGRVEHMYLDTRGFVTVGVGHFVQDASAAIKLPFINSTNNQLATADEIRSEFSRIKSRPFGKSESASKFKPFTKLILTEQFMDDQITRHIKNFEKELKAIYGVEQFSSFPDDVKLALFDMIFNLGMSKLRDSYTKFNGYIRNGNYVQAAAESKRNGVPTERNAYVANLLRSSR
jgi:GH24 family phage-related lysozyme (muramidase)